jgi:hypothetical protein
MKAWGNEPHTPKWAPTLGVRLSIDFRWTLESSKGNYRGSKVIGLKIFLYHWKALRTYMFKMGSHDPFGDLKHKLWPKEGVGNQIANLTPNHQKSGIALISLSASGLSHIVGKISSRAITLLETSLQSEVFKQSYGPPKSRESQFREFRDSNLGVSGQNDIWVLAPWPCT